MSYSKLGYSPFQPLVFTTTKQTQSWTIKTTAGAQYRFEWGDGTSTTITGNGAEQVTTHDYGSAGTRVILFGMWDCAKLLKLDCHGNGLTGMFPDVQKFVNLATIWAYTNTLTSAPASFSKCTKLVDVFLHYNSITGATPEFSGCTTLNMLNLSHNAFTSYTSQLYAPVCTSIRFEVNQLPAASVNLLLADVALGMAGRLANGTLNVDGAGNAAPTGQGLLDKATIEARPWTCATN